MSALSSRPYILCLTRLYVSMSCVFFLSCVDLGGGGDRKRHRMGDGFGRRGSRGAPLVRPWPIERANRSMPRCEAPRRPWVSLQGCHRQDPPNPEGSRPELLRGEEGGRAENVRAARLHPGLPVRGAQGALAFTRHEARLRRPLQGL